MRKGLLLAALAILTVGCGTRPAIEHAGRTLTRPPRHQVHQAEASFPPVPETPSFVVGYTTAGQPVSLSAAQTPLLVVNLADPDTPGQLGMVAREEQQLLAHHPGPPLMVVVEGVGGDVTQAVYRLEDLVASTNLVLPAVARAGAESPAPELVYQGRGELQEIPGWPDPAALATAQGEVVQGEKATFGVPLGRARHR